MERLVERLMRLLSETLGWQRALLVVQDEAGTVSWSLVPADEPLSIRINTDNSLSVTLGHREAGDAFLAELETLLESRAAPNGARTGAQAERTGDEGASLGQLAG
jgi:hypothetical protein